VLASSDHDSHQIIRYGPKAISTQFHPEMTPAILASIIRARSQALEAEGFMLAGLLDKLEDAGEARRLLRSFVDGSLG